MKYDHDNISPLDSRYLNKIPEFRKNFSESALIKIRFEIEIIGLYFYALTYPVLLNHLAKNQLIKLIILKTNLMINMFSK